MFLGFRERMAQRARSWALRRQGLDANPVTLESRRIYILPTGTGVMYGLTAFTILLGSMNYSNNMGFALGFLLAAIGLVCMHLTHNAMTGLGVEFIRANPVFAGQAAVSEIRLFNPGRSYRYELGAGWDRESGEFTDLKPGARDTLQLRLETSERGWLEVPRIMVTTQAPLGLFRAWAWVHMEANILVYPELADQRQLPPWPESPEGSGTRATRGDTDFSGLRDYQVGDSPRRIAWKAMARDGSLVVREYHEGGQSRLWLDIEQLPDVGIERRLSMLARMLVNAHEQGLATGLRLGAVTVPPGAGETHLRTCLRQLALFPGGAR